MFADYKIRPVLKSISCSKAKIISAEVINEAILEDMETNSDKYESIANLSTGEKGEILSVRMNMGRTNELKSRINMMIQQKLFEKRNKVYKIPLGTLLGWEIFNNQGPEIPINISSSGNVSSEFRSEFGNAGINQTLHKIYLEVHSHINVMIPGETCGIDTDNDILVSETVIVGSTPQMCNGFSQGNICAVAEKK